MAFFDNLKYELQKQNKLTILIVINLVLFLFINISVNMININVLDYLALPLNFKAFISHFWTLGTTSNFTGRATCRDQRDLHAGGG